MLRITFIIDGFNLYHSIRKASEDLSGASTKWLNVKALCSSYVYLFGGTAVLQEIYYFSALAKHLESNDSSITKRHQDFITCIEDTGVVVEVNRFKKKIMKCPCCNQKFKRYEEKETDVALATKLLELFILDSCDRIVLLTGDTDLAPAVRTANKLFPHKAVVFAFPYARKNKELSKIAPNSFEISKEQYSKHQFSDPYTLKNGIDIHKPSKW